MGIELKGTFTDVEAPASGGLLLGTGDMRKDQIMCFIVNFLREKGYCPSIREIGKGVGLRSPSSVYAYMKELAGELAAGFKQVRVDFYEADGLITYREVTKLLMARFAGGLYVHARIMGDLMAAFCRSIFRQDPVFFDDIPLFAGISDPHEKEEELVKFAQDCGLYHDFGLFQMNVERLKQAGIEAEADVYPDWFHAYDLIFPMKKVSREAIGKFEQHFAYALAHYFAPQPRKDSQLSGGKPAEDMIE